jgi:hypothetical protein
MLNEMYVTVENGKNSKLMSLFGTLEERDKDIVITMTESLIAGYKNTVTKTIGNFTEEKGVML